MGSPFGSILSVLSFWLFHLGLLEIRLILSHPLLAAIV